MAQFFENTWFVWWVVAIVVVLRWMHVVSLQDATAEADEFSFEEIEIENLKVHDHLTASAS